MDERVVERGEDVGNTEDELALSNLGTERDGGFFLGDLDLLRGLEVHPIVSTSIQPKFTPPRARHACLRVPGA